MTHANDATREPRPFKLGFTGSTIDAILPFERNQADFQFDKVLVAMAGSGKDIANLARPGRTVYSWDTQFLSAVVVEGIFSEPAAVPEPLERGEALGYACLEHPIRQAPYEAERLADYIATMGDDYDRACLAKALVRSTYMGRLGTWARDDTADTLWAKYLQAHTKLAAWRGLPGTFVHNMGSVFDAPDLAAIAEGALLLIDTPKVLRRGSKGDIYSAGFEGLNSILAQRRQVLPPWTEDTFRRDMPKLWALPWERMLMFHASGCLPGVGDVAAALGRGLGEPATVQQWDHGKRTDVCWVYDR